MTSPIYEALEADTPLASDGAMGTVLQDLGLVDGSAPELWNVEKPEAIKGILEGYAEAGARFLTTNTFGGTRPRLELHGLVDRVEELNAAGAQSEQIRGLVKGGIDAVLIETMNNLSEVEAAVRASQQVAPELPIIATMSFDANLRTMMGTTQNNQSRQSPNNWPRLASTGSIRSLSPTQGCRNYTAMSSNMTDLQRRWQATPSRWRQPESISWDLAAARPQSTPRRWLTPSLRGDRNNLELRVENA